MKYRWHPIDSPQSHPQRHAPNLRSQDLRIIPGESTPRDRYAGQTRPPQHRQHLLGLLRINLHHPHPRVHGRRGTLRADQPKEEAHLGRGQVLHSRSRYYIKLLIDAVRYCHDYGVIHRDIKVPLLVKSPKICCLRLTVPTASSNWQILGSAKFSQMEN